MPSFIFGGSSGGDLLISGNPWSGQIRPQAGIQLKLGSTSPGNIYVGLSGGVTVSSGGFFQSGGGLMDGMEITPGQSYWIPRVATGLSGNISIYVNGEGACSGVSRIYYEVY